MDLASLVPLVLKASIILIVFCLGLGAKWSDIAYLVRRPGLLARSVVAMYVLVPAIAVVLALTLEVPPTVKAAILLMSISAGAPVLPQKAIKVGANPAHVYSFGVIAALLAIVTVPISLAILGEIFHRDVMVTPGQVAGVIVVMFLAPVLAGMAIRHFFPALADRVGNPLMTAAMIVLVVLVVLVVAMSFSALAQVGWLSYVVFVILTFAALAVGHWLGGPEPGDRTALALACATRFPALAILIVTVNFPDAKPIPVILAFLLASNLAAIPYMIWRKRQPVAHRAEGATAGAARS